MSTGGLNVGIVGTEDYQMIAIANNLREVIEIRKFAVNMKEVLSVDYEQNRFAGHYITEEEAAKHKLKMPDVDHDEL
mgnify:CR=1 FL=1